MLVYQSVSLCCLFRYVVSILDLLSDFFEKYTFSLDLVFVLMQDPIISLLLF